MFDHLMIVSVCRCLPPDCELPSASQCSSALEDRMASKSGVRVSLPQHGRLDRDAVVYCPAPSEVWL